MQRWLFVGYGNGARIAAGGGWQHSCEGLRLSAALCHARGLQTVDPEPLISTHAVPLRSQTASHHHPMSCSGQQGRCAARPAGRLGTAVLPAAAGKRPALSAVEPPPCRTCSSKCKCRLRQLLAACARGVCRFRFAETCSNCACRCCTFHLVQPAPPPPKQKAGASPPTDSGEALRLLYPSSSLLPSRPAVSSSPQPNGWSCDHSPSCITDGLWPCCTWPAQTRVAPFLALAFCCAVGPLAKLNDLHLPLLFVCGEFDRNCPGARLKEVVADVLPDCDARIVSLEVRLGVALCRCVV